MSWVWEVERLGLLGDDKNNNNNKNGTLPMPNLRNFCTGLRLFPVEYAYAIAMLYLSRNHQSLTISDLQDVLQIVTETIVRKLPADFNPVLLANVYRDVINVRQDWKQEKIWAWFQDIVLPKCCAPPSQKSTVPYSLAGNKIGKHGELHWSKAAREWLPPGYNVYNPSICGEYTLLRTAQYRINYLPNPRYESWDPVKNEYGPYTYTRTVNYIHHPRFKEPIQLSSVPVPFPNGTISGLEDMRLFYWPQKSSHYAVTTSLEVTPDRAPRQCLVKINPDSGKVSHLVYIRGCPELALERRKQKNWLPYICPITGQLCFIYSYCPFITLQYNPEDCRVRIKHAYIPTTLNHWRGSAGPVWLPLHNQYVALVHESAWPRYCHRFIALDKKMEKITHASDRFTFGTDFKIEFSCGMQLSADQQSMTVLYALHDAKAFSTELPISWILGFMRDYY